MRARARTHTHAHTHTHTYTYTHTRTRIHTLNHNYNYAKTCNANIFLILLPSFSGLQNSHTFINNFLQLFRVIDAFLLFLLDQMAGINNQTMRRNTEIVIDDIETNSVAPSIVRMPILQLERQIYSQQGFRNRYPPYVKDKVTMTDCFNNFVNKKSKLMPTVDKCKSIVKRFLPCLPRMRHYKCRQWLAGDVISGLTLGAIHIPQCLGFSAVVQVLPAFGLYSSFFPILIYFIFGSSHSISIGTVAIISLLTGNFITGQYTKYSSLFSRNASKLTSDYQFYNNISHIFATIPTFTTEAQGTADIKNAGVLNMDITLAIATTASFIIGLIQLGMGIFRLGMVTCLMSTPFNSAYMTAIAIHTAINQFPAALGFQIRQYPGAFTLPFQLRDIILHLPNTNAADIITALFSIAFLIFIKEFINVKYHKKLRVPIPAELIVVIVGTLLVYITNLHTKYHIKIMGAIPRGFPVPAVPALVHYVDTDFFIGCLIISVVACVECLTMAKIFARKYRYNIDANQEFIAYGLVNLISSFFHCFPTAQSPPRTMIFDTSGGKTQLSSLVSAALILVVIVGVGPLFQHLPKACLAAIVIVGLFPLIKHFKELKFYWLVQKWDFLAWILTCLSALILDLAIGLCVGICWNLMIILTQSLFVRGYTMWSTHESDIFVRSNTYHNTCEIDGIKIFRFESDLFFANVARFKNQLYQTTVNPNKLMLIQKKITECDTNDNKHENVSTTKPSVSNGDIEENKNNNSARKNVLVTKKLVDVLSHINRNETDISPMNVRSQPDGSSDMALKIITPVEKSDGSECCASAMKMKDTSTAFNTYRKEKTNANTIFRKASKPGLIRKRADSPRPSRRNSPENLRKFSVTWNLPFDSMTASSSGLQHTTKLKSIKYKSLYPYKQYIYKHCNVISFTINKFMCLYVINIAISLQIIISMR